MFTKRSVKMDVKFTVKIFGQEVQIFMFLEESENYYVGVKVNDVIKTHRRYPKSKYDDAYEYFMTLKEGVLCLR